MSPGVFEKTPVKTGAQSGGRILVLGGLRSGDRIIVDGVMLLTGAGGGAQ